MSSVAPGREARLAGPALGLVLLGCVAPPPEEVGADAGCDPFEVSCAPERAGCPPAGDVGVMVGDVVPNHRFARCDGTEVELHGLCGLRMAVVVAFYGWCPSCYDMIELADDLQGAYGDRGLRSVVVVLDTPANQPADADYCSRIEANLILRATPVLDPERAFEAYGDTSVVMLLDQTSRILFLDEEVAPETVRAVVAEEMGT